jgi:hypothetical protein
VAAWLQSSDWSSGASNDGLSGPWSMSAWVDLQGFTVALRVIVDSADEQAIAWWETESGLWLGFARVGSS